MSLEERLVLMYDVQNIGEKPFRLCRAQYGSVTLV